MTGQLTEAEFMQQQQREQIANDPNAVLAHDLRDERATNILQQLNPDNLLEDLEHRIRGEKKQGNTWVVISSDKAPVSEEMVSDFISFLGSILNQNTAMSNFAPKEINNIMEFVRHWYIDHMVVNAQKYGIEGDYSEYDRIGHIVCSNCFIVLKRAQNGQESRRIFKMMKMNESSSNNNKKGGFMDNFKVW